MLKKTLIIIVLFVSVIICGCAKQDMTSETIVGKHSKKDIVVENDRHIEENYGSGEFIFKINADIIVPDSEIQYGKLINDSFDISMVEQYLFDGEKLIEKEIQMVDESTKVMGFASSKVTTNNTLGYDIAFYEVNEMPGDAVFNNYRLDRYLSGSSSVPKSEIQWTDIEQSFVAQKKKLVDSLFKNLQLEGEFNGTVLSVGDVYSDCYFYLNMCLDGFPLISKDNGNFIQSIVQICDQGISSIGFSGLLNINNASIVNILSIDEALKIVEEGVSEKHINTYSDTIESLRLSYMVDTSEAGLIFYPVWCFSNRINGAEELTPCLCINAQNGLIEYMR